MRGSVKSTAGDLIVEPIEEAVTLYDDLLNALHKSKIRAWKTSYRRAHYVHCRQQPPSKQNRPSDNVKYSSFANQNILYGPEYRYFASLAKRPTPDSLEAFNKIVSKITQQSINTINAMLPHVIYKISISPDTPIANPDKMVDAGPAELFDVIQRRLKLGNDIHMTFKRVGKSTLDNLQRLKEQNEVWLKVWESGLMQLEPKTVRLSFDQVKNAMMNLERTMAACLRAIHTHQMKKGW
ncbi:hypothetical protein E4T52_16406 [Aureobasidium sp. EXF-3400]|nr:hypothetical protein E4T51_15663 [Aureobasidium sp. EXF-12344]KAI4768510.1 hypothetical protein E4T52_16406 [Aureobasidium sp. EXF-3400]